jgi:hypothetical protein
LDGSESFGLELGDTGAATGLEALACGRKCAAAARMRSRREGELIMCQWTLRGILAM